MLIEQIMAGMFVAVGASLLIFELLCLWLAHNSRAWIETRGIVTESKINGRRRRSGSFYRLQVRYSYEVRRKKRRGWVIYLGGRFSFTDPQQAEAEHKAYAPGKQVSVYYHPGWTALATLNTGVRSEQYRLIAFAFCFTLFSLWLWSQAA